MRTVYIANRGFHDNSEAERYGRLVALTDGAVNLRNVRKLEGDIQFGLRHYREDDILLINGHPIINALAHGFLQSKYGKINLLYYIPGSGYKLISEAKFDKIDSGEAPPGEVLCPQCNRRIALAPSGVRAFSEEPCSECLLLSEDQKDK